MGEAGWRNETMSGRITPKEVYRCTGEAEVKINKIIGQYDAYINKLINDNRRWQMVGVLSVLIILVSIFGWIYIAGQRKEHLLVVEVNELGRAKYIGNVSSGGYLRGYQVKDYMVEAIIRDFIEYTRSISVDTDRMSADITKTAAWCSNDMKLKLRNELVADDPFASAGKIKRTVSIESGIKITDFTWQYDWFDIVYSMYGQEISRIRFRGMFTVVIKEPETDNERFNNPLGVYIVDYNISRVNEVLR